jgi:hypothetical protein
MNRLREIEQYGDASMSHYRILPEGAEPGRAYSAQPVACPNCGVVFTFCRSDNPAIDACGFESYTFACKECGASLSGIVDPLDDALLITELTD